MGALNSTFTSSAPGRLDVMGGFADYSGSMVLQMPIAEKTTVQFTARHDGLVSVRSHAAQESLSAIIDVMPLLTSDDFTLERAYNFFSEKNLSWAAYVVGCAILLHHQKRIDFTGGDFVVESTVPLGKGVSSSAALEVATMKVLSEAFHISFSGTELARLAQQVENKLVGAPCGLMDQLACYHGVADHLLPITCQPDILYEPLAIPSPIKFIGLDSGVRHAVSGASYTDVRCAAFMGYSIIAQALGVSKHSIQQARKTGDMSELPFAGYLANITPDVFETQFMGLLPKAISGKEFINQWGATTDAITTPQADKNYAVQACTRHPIMENDRVKKFKTIFERLRSQFNLSKLEALGELMYEAHQGYTLCGLQTARTDEIVALAKQAPGIYGAKITGGGSGGCVCLLTFGDEGIASANTIRQELQNKYNTKLALLI